ncbi:ABC transporter related protein [Ferroglobus placidus DSM 10642]|uniref:Probable branched-chain amino acid transport ATP-binding protein LivG n=1 Tax=Ferroglobus placidus (strain DSM 10642 / AEDII12DO) TaxID=589924 RepID=D3RZB3_FERPA|nr:ABC transporter ATP-binding protein [Ferroglobus placidus]ADC65826.1 ABC transporter related protein [Ferroglobus placidus DSM 10642]
MLLRVENLRKSFGGIKAVDGVTFEIEEGEAIGIVGPNGSGKTTLYNLISGIYLPDEGKVIFEGRDITNLPPYERAKLGIARTFQIPRPFGNATVLENVAIGAMFGREKLSVEEAFERAEEYLKLVGIEKLKHKEAKLLTPLEKRLMELARALAMKPKLLLLDEVMAGMNPVDVDRIIELLKKIHREEDIAIVSMVEHLMQAIVKFAERVIVMHQGKILVEGEPEKVLNHPKVIEVYLGKKVI